jgi:methyl-accepting chemotaxis protein
MELLFGYFVGLTEAEFAFANDIIFWAVFIIIVGLIWLKRKDTSALKSLPSIFTIIGVFGTFFGITIGLMNFNADPGEIEKSVSFLLGGMKTAFGSSILGMGAAVGIRVYNVVYGNKEDNIEEADKVLALLKSQNTSLKHIREGIASDSEDSLTSHIQKLRLDFSDFAKNQAKMNVEQLQKSLEKVIKDFNDGMQEQFGENFKELNKAVFKLVEWQENYHKQIEYMVKTIEQTNGAVENSKQIIQDISEKYSDTYKLTEDFETVIKMLNNENKKLMDGIEKFAKLGNEANEAMPLIEKQLTSLTSGFTSTVESTLGDIKSSSKESSSILTKAMKESSDGMTNTIKTSLKTIQDSSELTNTEIKKTVKTIQDSSELANTEIKKTIKSSTDDVNNQLKELYKNSFDTLKQLQEKMADDLNQNINDIDGQIGNVLQNSLNSLSTSLSTLSDKFVQDYSPLTEKLRELVEIAGKIEIAYEDAEQQEE